MKMRLKLSSAKWQPFCLGGDESIPLFCQRYIQAKKTNLKGITKRSQLLSIIIIIIIIMIIIIMIIIIMIIIMIIIIIIIKL